MQFRNSFKLYWMLQFGSPSKISQQFQLGNQIKTSQWNFIQSSSLRFDLTFFMSVLWCSSKSGLKQNHPKWNLTKSSTRGSTKLFASKTLLKVKLYWFSLGHNNQTLSKSSSCSSCLLVLECVCTLKSLFSSYTGKNHNSVSLFAWNCFMKIIVCVFVTNYWCIMRTCPE